MSANFNYSTPWLELQGKGNAWFSSSFNANKDVIKDKLSLSMGVNNPFTKFRDYNSNTTGANFAQTAFGQRFYRSYNASLNWRFGKLKDEIKKNNRGISNDDVGGKG
ncbi:MAG: hypothetical protein EOP48_31785 [Sphingobacteriales bacterium]|nr:MAG: hypothetical protein EOP48_31785 [Sphingobacteriales bacterium]